MIIPKIIFSEMTLEENIDTIKWAYYENNGSLSVGDFTIKYFPELSVFDENTPKNLVYKKIEEVVTKDYNFYKERIKSETLHFVWFKKWKQIHPEIPRREYDSPYISWKYSEMVTDPILNNKPFSDMFRDVFIERGYDSFYELRDGDNLVMDILRNIYSENISIEEKINKGFDYIKSVLSDKKTNI